MEAVVQIMDAGRLASILNIPNEMLNSRVEVTVRPIEEAKSETVSDRLNKFRKKHNEETFKAQLREKLVQGVQFQWDVEKYLSGAFTDEDWQEYYRYEKRTGT